PPASTRRRQQQNFDRFRIQYNQQRPHEALAMRTPAALYSASPRPYPERLPKPEYDSGLLVRKVHSRGQFFWKHQQVFLTKVLTDELIALEPIDDRFWCVLFSTFPIAYFDAQQLTVGSLPS